MNSYHPSDPRPAPRSADTRSALEVQVRTQVLGLVLAHWPAHLWTRISEESDEVESTPNPVCFPCALRHAAGLTEWVLTGRSRVLDEVVDDHHRRE